MLAPFRSMRGSVATSFSYNSSLSGGTPVVFFAMVGGLFRKWVSRASSRPGLVDRRGGRQDFEEMVPAVAVARRLVAACGAEGRILDEAVVREQDHQRALGERVEEALEVDLHADSGFAVELVQRFPVGVDLVIDEIQLGDQPAGIRCASGGATAQV